MKSPNAQNGFTIVELLVATAVFSLVLLMAAAGVLEVTRMYYRGVVQSRTQETARVLLDELAESIRFGTAEPSSLTFVGGPDINDVDPDTGHFCLGPRRYTYAIDRALTEGITTPANKQKKHVFWVDQPTTLCSITGASADLDNDNPSHLDPGVVGRELLSENMRLTRLRVERLGAEPNTFRIELGVAYGSNDALEPDGDYKICKPGDQQSEFCATSNLTVTVTRRLD